VAAAVRREASALNQVAGYGNDLPREQVGTNQFLALGVAEIPADRFPKLSSSPIPF
jgi:hypothetical protein